MRINSILRRKTNLGWKTKLRWRARLSESTARETAHLIAMVLNMHLDPAASRARRMTFSNAVVEGNAVMHPNQAWQAAEAEPAIQVVLHWRRFNQQRCHVEILSNREGPLKDPWSLAIANRLRQVLN
jgi:hypothetical protein